MPLQLDNQALDERELRSALGPHGEMAISAGGLTFEELGHELAAMSSESAGLGLASLWEAVRQEFREMLCGTAPRYEEVRRQASAFSTGGTAALVTGISAAIATAIGISAVAIAPLIALLLLAVRKVGVAAICRADYLEARP